VQGFGLGMNQPTVISLIYRHASADRTGEALGVRMMVMNASHTFMPLLFGALAAAAGPAMVFWLTAAATLRATLFAWRQRAAEEAQVR